MNELKVFDSPEFGQVRTIVINSEPWFVGKDVAVALGYSDTADAVRSHVDNDDRMGGQNTDPYILDSMGRKQYPVFINESGVYSLVFGSKLPNAKKFKHWVTSEVLPSIRKHGMYAVDELIANPELAIRAFTALKEEREKNKALQEDNERMKPKAEFFDAVTDSKDAIDMGQVAKVLNYPRIGRNKLFEILRDNGILQQNNQPYQKYIDCGYFRVIEQKYEARPGEIRINIKTLVFQKGIDYIKKLLDKVA